MYVRVDFVNIEQVIEFSGKRNSQNNKTNFEMDVTIRIVVNLVSLKKIIKYFFLHPGGQVDLELRVNDYDTHWVKRNRYVEKRFIECLGSTGTW